MSSHCESSDVRLALLRFITCGSVDDGKSTLMGRLLWEAHQIYEDQWLALQNDSRRFGTQGQAVDYALLMDGLLAEREQGITIDVAYRFFSTARRKFVVADTPGHEQYTRNMVTGASNADAAVLLVDARQGVVTQTRRHAYLVGLMGIRNVVLAVNKMDLVGYDAAAFKQIRDEFDAFAKSINLSPPAAIPLSALKGDNVTQRSRRMSWYTGPTLIGYLESIDPPAALGGSAVFPVQWVNRPNADFRGYAGTLARGSVHVGDELRVTRSGQTALVAEIVTHDASPDQASAGRALTLRLDREIDVSRGDVLSCSTDPVELTDQLEVVLVWTAETVGLTGRVYDIKIAGQWGGAQITTIKHRINVNDLAREACTSIGMNDIVVVNLALSRLLAVAPYADCKDLGALVLVDRFSCETLALGMVHHSLRRAQNVHAQPLTIARPDRERLNGHPGKVVWFTGLSGSGKSTLANALEVALHAQGKRTYILDGDNVRQGLNKDLGFTDADRVENIRRVAEVAKLMMDAGLIVMTAFISPFRQEREMARALIGPENFIEVYVSTPLEVCEQRDPKGLYKKARRGDLPNFSGIGSSYEPPYHPDVVVDTNVQSTDLCTEKAKAALNGLL